MKRVIAICILCLMLVGCASTLTYNTRTGDITAKDYTIKISTNGTITAAPNRWFNTSFIKSFLDNLVGMVKGGVL